MFEDTFKHSDINFRHKIRFCSLKEFCKIDKKNTGNQLKAVAVYKTCNRTKPNRTYGNYRTYPVEPTEIIEHPDRTYGNYDLSISGINCITCQNENFEDQAPISLFTKDFM